MTTLTTSPRAISRARLARLALALAVWAGIGAWSPAAWAGAWVQLPGLSYVKVSLLGQRAQTRIAPDGRQFPADPTGGDYVERQIYSYGEWGVSERITALASWAYKDQRVEGGIASWGTRSLGDLRVGGRWGPVQGPRAVAIESLLSIPTYPTSDLSRPPAEREQYLPAGTGHLQWEIRGLGGLSLYPIPLYANLDVGYRFRAGNFSNELLGAVEFGGGNRNLFAKAELRAIFGVDEPQFGTQAGSVSQSERSLRLGFELNVRLWSFTWLSLGVNPLLAGRNTLNSDQWAVGLVFWNPPG